MAAVLDLIWTPTTAHPTPPAGQFDAIVRDRTFLLPIYQFNAVKDGPLVVPDGTTFAAQLRATRIKADIDPGDPLASFTITTTLTTGDEPETGDPIAFLLALELTPDDTQDLPPKGFWDLAMYVGDRAFPWFYGKFKVLDNVTPAPAP